MNPPSALEAADEAGATPGHQASWWLRPRPVDPPPSLLGISFRVGLLAIQWITYAVVGFGLEAEEAYNDILYSAPSIEGVAVSTLILVLLAIGLPATVRRPTDALLWAFSSLVVVPTVVVATTNPVFDLQTRALAVTSSVLAFFVVVLVRGRGVPLRPRADVLDRPTFTYLLWALALAGSAIVVFGFGIKGLTLDFGSVYDRRLEAREASTSIPGAGYMVDWLKTLVLPLLVCLALAWRYLWFLGLAGLVVVVVFSFTGEKSVIYSIPLVLLIYFAASQERRGNGWPWFGSVLTAVLAVPAVFGLLTGSWALVYLFPRRLGYIPGVLAHQYIEFTEGYKFTWFSHSWLKLVATDPALGPGEAVGRAYYNEAANATASAISDGYFSAGLVGVAIVALVLALVLRFVDRLALSRDKTAMVPVLAATCWGLTEGALHTRLLTGGILVGIVLVWISPDPRNRASPARDRRPGGSVGSLGCTTPGAGRWGPPNSDEADAPMSAHHR